MDATNELSTRIGLGYATHADAFQRGREAAQAAKRQLPDGPLDLVLIFGPPTVHFKDFIEGARLVIGEDCLVALPTNRTMSNETTLNNTCFIAAFQAPDVRISIAMDEVASTEILRGSTSLISQFRKHRGNALREYSHRGCLAFSHHIGEKKGAVAATLAADMGIESWMLGAATLAEKGATLACLNKTLRQGLVGIEVLSHSPWGVGSVAIGSFRSHADVYREAVKAALRDALSQMPEGSPAFGLVIFDLSEENEAGVPDDILSGVTAAMPNIPLLGISAARLFVRRPQRSIPQQNDSVLALLVPE